MSPAERARKQPQQKPEATEEEPSGPLSGLFSGKMTEVAATRKKRPKREKAVEVLPESLRRVADVLAAGKAIEKEIRAKIGYSEQRIKEYCVRRFCERFIASGHRPTSSRYAGGHSRFTFIQTKRIFLNPEKADALRMMNIPVDDFTELGGIDIDYAAIKENHLEFKLRAALEKMDVPEDIINACFRPRIELRESFFETLNTVVKNSLQEGEDTLEKMIDVVSVLAPVNQIKSPEITGVSPEDGFRLVIDTEIPAPTEEKGAA